MFEDARQCKLMISPGRRATGKTIETLSTIFDYVKGDSANGVQGRKALIFDVNNEFETFYYPGFDNPFTIDRMYIADIQRFVAQRKIEVRRIAPFTDDGTRMNTKMMQECLEQILYHYKNGMLLVEDLNKYIGDNPPSDIIGSLATLRQSGVDVIMHVQNMGRIGNPKILGNTNIARVHYTNDSVSRHKDKFEEKVDILSLAENIVRRRYRQAMDNIAAGQKNQLDQFFFLFVDFDYNKIKASPKYPFTYYEAIQSVKDYLASPTGKSLINLIKDRRDDNNKLMYNEDTAYAAVKESLLKEYFSFTD